MPSRAASAWRSCTARVSNRPPWTWSSPTKSGATRWKGRAFARGPAWPARGRTSDPPTWGCAPELVHAGPVDRFLDCGYRCVRPCHQRQAIATLRALRVDSRDRTRPVVGVELLPIVLSRGTCELVIQNIGASVAKNILVTFDPPIRESMGVTAGYAWRVDTSSQYRRWARVAV